MSPLGAGTTGGFNGDLVAIRRFYRRLASTARLSGPEGCYATFQAAKRHDRPKPGQLKRSGLAGVNRPAHDNGYFILSIMTCPKPEQLTWLAPSIKRAKSYVTFLLRIDFFMELMMRSAAFTQPM